METAKRFWESWTVATTMTFAWCLFFGYQWLLARFIQDEMILGVCLALFASGFCFLKIYGCDKWSDSLTAGLPEDKEDPGNPDLTAMKPSEKYLYELKSKILDTVIDANGILVGFAWERCFDTAVLDLSLEVQNETHGKMN